MMRGIGSAIVGLAVILAAIVWLARQERPSTIPPDVSNAPAKPVDSAKLSAERASAVSNPKPCEKTATSPTPPAAPAAAPTPPLDSAEILLRGTVHDEHGKPVPDFWMYWYDDAGAHLRLAGKDGAYSLAGLHPGHHVVTLVAVGWRREDVDVDLAPAPEIQTRDFVLQTLPQIVIRLATPSGAAPTGAGFERRPFGGNSLRVYATRKEPPSFLPPRWYSGSMNSECGVFDDHWFSNLDLRRETDVIGTLALTAPPPLFVSLFHENVLLATRRIEEIPRELAFTLEPDALRSKLSGVRVRLLQADGRTPVTKGGVNLGSAGGPTDAEGRSEWLDQLPGPCTLVFRALGAAAIRRDVELVPSEVLDLGDVVMKPGPDFLIRFEFPGEFHSSVQFSLRPESRGDPFGTLDGRPRYDLGSEPDGRARIPFPGPGAYELRVLRVNGAEYDTRAHFGARPVRVVLGAEPAGEIVVRLEPTTEVWLRAPRGCVGDSQWLITSVDGVPAEFVQLSGRAPRHLELLPGEYTIARVEEGTRELGKAQSFTVGAGIMSLELKP